MRRYFIDSALHWLDHYGFDGLRLDSTPDIHDASALHYLTQLTSEVAELSDSLNKSLACIAETDRNAPRDTAPAPLGHAMDGVWNDDFHHAVHYLLTGEEHWYFADFTHSDDMTRVLTRNVAYDGRYSAFHRRTRGADCSHIAPHRFVAHVQNHDQIGNRPRGERLAALVGADVHERHNGQLVAATLLLLSPFTAMLFMGEEWGETRPFSYFADFPGPYDAGLNRAVARGRAREALGRGYRGTRAPAPSKAATVQASRINWTKTTQPDHASILDTYRELIRLRKTHFAAAPSRREASRHESVVRAAYTFADHTLTVLANIGTIDANCPDNPATHGTADIFFATRHEAQKMYTDHHALPAHSAIALLSNNGD